MEVKYVFYMNVFFCRLRSSWSLLKSREKCWRRNSVSRIWTESAKLKTRRWFWTRRTLVPVSRSLWANSRRGPLPHSPLYKYQVCCGLGCNDQPSQSSCFLLRNQAGNWRRLSCVCVLVGAYTRRIDWFRAFSLHTVSRGIHVAILEWSQLALTLRTCHIVEVIPIDYKSLHNVAKPESR